MRISFPDEDSPGGLALVTRTKSDPKFYNDSRLWYAICKYLNRKGYDVIKKLMCKDGHLVSDTQHYVRARNKTWCIHDPNYQIENAYVDFNKGFLVLRRQSLA